MPDTPPSHTGAVPGRRFRVSVRVRILATLLLLTALGMVAAGATAYLVQRERTLDAVDDRLASLAADAQFVASDSGAETGGLSPVLSAIIQRLRPGANESSLALIDGRAALSPGGTVDFRLDDSRALIDRVVQETSGAAAVRGTVPAGGTLSAGGTLRYVAVPVSVEGDPRQGLYLAAVDLDAELRPLTSAFGTYAAVAAGALVVVAIAGWFVAGRLLRPIRALTDAANRITVSDLRERIPVAGRDDVSELTTTVNGMLDRLDIAVTRQHQLLDDVGHELKTPLTIVRGHLELMQVDDPADVAAARELAIDEVDRMSGLVRDITVLAGSERASGGLVFRTVELRVFLERLRAKATALADRDWVVVEAPDAAWPLDDEKLTQALLQLAVNAVAHGSDGVLARRIELGASIVGPHPAPPPVSSDLALPPVSSHPVLSPAGPTASELRLWVRDTGPGIEPAMQQRIFDRFQRGPQNAGRGRAGSGLGLAIVSGIAAAHGGRIELDSQPGQGACFTIVIPETPADGGTR